MRRRTRGSSPGPRATLARRCPDRGESTRTTPAEGERLVRIVRRLMEHGVLMSITGLGCLSTPMGEPELEGLVETFAAVLEMEHSP